MAAPDQAGPSGKWESEEIRPAAQQRQVAGNWLKPITDALRVPFGALWDDPRGRPLILVSLLALVGVCALSCFILSVALLSNPPTPGPIGATAVVGPTAPITAALIINANNTPIPPGVPNRLTIGNATLDVVPVRPDDQGQWQYDRNAQKTAFWVVGTLVNYVMGLPASDENRALLDSLVPNDLLVLDTSVGTLRYRMAQTETIKVDEQGPLRNQSYPQLTLMLLNENGDERHAIVAHYTDEGTPNSLTPIGVPINLGDVRVTALNSRMLPGTTVGLPADQNYYQVNIQVTSLITRHLDASQFTAQLIDAAGNRYSISSQGSFASGGAGWTQGALSPGDTISATAGFEVPANMPGPKLEWSFTTEADNPYLARVIIPYEQIAVAPTSAPTAAPIAEVTILNVSITPEGNELRIVGTVRNTTGDFLPVSLRDLSLDSNGTLSPLNASLPAFPWSITAGETLAFQLTFARPPGGTSAVFTMFGQSFEIMGL
ncbi:MAG: hypothetical protein M1546_27435 [Chloroflexi bacterium]|nr:hypothetical protein [Chloroflexota bacterium]